MFDFPHDIDGWLRPDEGLALADLARGKRVLEIGSYCGLSTVCLARTAESVVSVDPHDGRSTPAPRDTTAAFWANLDRYGVRSKVKIHVGTVSDIPDGPDYCDFDLVFIDGAHDYESVQTDIAKALERLAPNGLLAFHDYRRFPGAFDGRWDPGVTQSVDELIKAENVLVSTHATIAVVQPTCCVIGLAK